MIGSCALVPPALAQSTAPAPAAATAPAPAPAPAPRFDIFEYRVEGNTVLPVEQVERAVYGFLGEQRSAGDVESARAALEAAYRQAGFGTVVVDTPEQRVANGVVVLQVTEAPVARLRVVGAKHYSQGRIIAAVPALAEGSVPNFNAATAQLATVNRGSDRQVTPLLRPGKAPGTTEVDLTVADKLPLHGGLELNDRYSVGTTKTRLSGNIRYDNLWQREHSLGLQFQLTPEDRDEVQVLSASYSLPLPDGLLILSATRSDSNTVSIVQGNLLTGNGRILGARRILTLGGDEHFSHSLTLGVDYKNMKEDNVDLGYTPVRYIPFSLAYSAIRNDSNGSWQYGAGLSLSLRGLASDEIDFANKRYQAHANFAVLKFELGRSLKLPWRGLGLFARLDGQIANQPLISNEQFVAGGVDSVRGYPEAAAVGDDALRASLELRSGELAAEGARWFTSLTAHAFAEGAYLWVRSPLPQQQARHSLSSVGLGLRLRLRDRARFALDLAWPLHAAFQTPSGKARIHASAAVDF